MALVLPNNMVPTYLNEKMAVKDGVTEAAVVDGVTHLEVITYPSQEGFEGGAVLGMLQKPFIDFAAACGGKGAMTAAQIMEKYPVVPEALATAVAADFAVAYGNYVIIPDGMSLAITAAPYASIFDLLIPEEPAAEPAMV